jgi:hypothetical protein
VQLSGFFVRRINDMPKQIIDLRDMPLFFEEIPQAAIAPEPELGDVKVIDGILPQAEEAPEMPDWLKRRLRNVAVAFVMTVILATGLSRISFAGTISKSDVIERPTTVTATVDAPKVTAPIAPVKPAKVAARKVVKRKAAPVVAATVSTPPASVGGGSSPVVKSEPPVPTVVTPDPEDEPTLDDPGADTDPDTDVDENPTLDPDTDQGDETDTGNATTSGDAPVAEQPVTNVSSPMFYQSFN